jgi:endonuclease YncB( thermonuclease family)
LTYTTLRGEFVIRYPDSPRQGPEPDGDTVKFQPDTPALVEGLPRRSGTPADLGPRGISVRLEAIDALETHFGETHQELEGATAARELLLANLGFTNVRFYQDQPNKVESADQNSLRGHVLSNGIDANGRVIGFVYPGDPPAPDGTEVFVDEALVDESANAVLLGAGLAYPAFYGTLPASLRNHLAVASRTARAAQPPIGIWPRATGDPDHAAQVTGLAQLQTLVLWPKLFRRIVPYLAAGFTDFDGFDAWLRADPVHRDDALFLLDTGETGNLHDVLHGSGDSIAMTVWPEDFIIEPDPVVGNGGVEPRLSAAADVLIVAVTHPAGRGVGGKTVTLINTTAMDVDLAGWRLLDGSNDDEDLAGVLAAGATCTIRLGSTPHLDDRGDTLLLTAPGGKTVDRVGYTARQVRRGRTICFGR